MSNEIEASTSKHKDVVMDVDAWEKSMIMKMEEYTKEPTKEEEIPTIYRVPERIRLGVNDPYEPQVMSIGPYHRGKPTLEAMEMNKWWCLRQVLSRNKKQQQQLQDYIVAIKELEVRARSCYSEKKEINLINSEDFVEMMLLDGCFIVQFLREEYPIYHFKEQLVSYDMLLLENQIPFFILECISNLSITDDRHEIPIMELAKRFCSIMLYHSTRNFMLFKLNIVEEIPLDSVHHLLHMFHAFHTFTPQLNQDNTPPEETNLDRVIPSATDLQDAGVKFRKKRATHNLLEVTFEDGVFEIPPLFMSDASESEFRNLIAFEQLYPSAGNQFSQYARFMDDIISTSNDVALLHKADIIQYMVGSTEDVVHLFNKMSRNVISERDRFTSINKNVNRFYYAKRTRWRASLVHDYVVGIYFTNPWAAISLAAATILLILTFIQTYFSVYSAFHS